MSIIYQERPSDAPFVETVSHVQAIANGFATIPADGRLYLYVRRHEGKACLAVGGPITRAMSVPQVEGTEWVGIRFKLGTVMPHLPARTLVDSETILPGASSTSFWLNGAAWQFPDHENVETFVEWLARDGLLIHEPLVDAILQDQPPQMSLRSIQRRFVQATGLTYSTIRQIERARRAAALLQQGSSILDTVYEAGYFDQPHLTRSLKRLLGQTPAQIR